MPNPFIEVRANFDRIEGQEWPEDATVTINIDDPGTPAVNPDYTDTATVGAAPWDPNQTYFELALWGMFDIQPDFVVTVTDGLVSREYTVTNLAFTNISINADTVSGIAAPNSQIYIWACEFNNCFNLDEVPVDGSGNWSADFGGVYDIQPGTWIDSVQRDEFGNGTMFGTVTPGAEIAGTIYAVESLPGNEAGGVMVEACNTDQSVCRNALTDENGNYTVEYLSKGEFDIKAYPAGDDLPGYSDNPINITDYITYVAENIVLPGPPTPPPPGAIEPSHEGGGTIVVYIGDPLTLTTHGDPGGTATFEITVYEDGYTDNGPMAEAPAGSGTYIATIPPLSSHHGVAEIVYTITYSDGSSDETSFFIYIDPSGIVETVDGVPLRGATVTLLRSDSPNGPFEIVPNGSVLMSPSNRTNPDSTDEYGKYGWDVLAGFYIVRAELDGCYSPDDPSQPFVESEVLTIPPPVTDLILILECPDLPPVANAGEDQSVNEGDLVTFNGSTSYDPEGGDLVYAWDLDNDGEYDDGYDVTAEWIFNDNGNFTIGLQVTDPDDLTDTDTVEITVSNLPPQSITFLAPTDPIQTGSPVSVTAFFQDAGANDTHTASWDWGDNTTSAGTVDGHTVTGEHPYTVPGVYTLTLTIRDDDGGEATAYYEYVVYDPEGGFVTGGGWFDTSDGKANFGFNAKYHMDAKIPYGNTQFQVDGMKFKATSYNWLVVSDARAQFKGTGTIDNAGEYGFLVTIIDGKIAGDNVDLFRIKIWELTTGNILYDTQPGDSDAADPVTEIGGGSIVVHKAK